MTKTTDIQTEIEDANPGERARFQEARQAAAGISEALGTGSKAYVAGSLEIGRTLGGFGREMLTETGEHLRATVRAKNLRELAELQAAFAQHRIEMSATYAKELADLARTGSEQAIAPIADLLKEQDRRLIAPAPNASRNARPRPHHQKGWKNEHGPDPHPRRARPAGDRRRRLSLRRRALRRGGRALTATSRPSSASAGRMTYAEIDAAATAFAAWLQARLGVKRGDRIALMCPNVFAFPIAMLGIVRAGAAQVNVNPLYTPRELAHQLNDAGAETIVVFGGSTPTLAEIIDQTPVRTVITVDLGDGAGLAIPSPAVDPRLAGAVRFADVLAEGRDLPFEPVALAGDDILFFQYTGGTTGLSKGAVLSHRNLVANTEQFKAFLPEATEPGAEVLVLALPLYHIFGLMMMLAYATVGARAVLIPNPRDMDALHRRDQGREDLGAARRSTPCSRG